MKKLLLASVALIFAVTFATGAIAADAEKDFGSKVGQYYAELSTSEYEGDAVELKSLWSKGTVAFVMISPTCTLCRAEIAELTANAGEKADKVFIVIASAKNHADRFMKKYKAPFKVFLDSDFEMMAAGGFRITPSTIIVDKDGKITERFSHFKVGQAKELMEKL